MGKPPGLTLAEWHTRYLQQARWTADLRTHLFHLANIEKSKRVLEVGCGTSAVLSTLNAYTNITKIGIDINYASLKFSRSITQQAQFCSADAGSLPFPSGCFDISFCHFLLLWVSFPPSIVSEMRRITRPGGYVMAFAEPDYAARIDFPDNLVDLGIAQTQALQNQGADTKIGRKLNSIFHRAGLKNVEIGLLGGHWRITSSQAEWESEWTMLQSDLSGYIPPEQLENFQNQDLAARHNGERVLFIPTFWAVGVAD